MIRAAVILCLSLVSLSAAELPVESYLDATREIENWQGRDGRHGERGAYGIRAACWAQHMGDMDFALARQERWGRECARRHVRWLQRELHAAGIDPSPYNVALAYNAGLARVLTGRIPASAYDYANRLTNLLTVTVKTPKS
jgi:hypothetical protein